MVAKWVYRLESIVPNKGLWYDHKGNFVETLKSVPNNTSHKLPMGYDERYKQDGKNWWSSCSRMEDLTHWYTVEDVRYLLNNGFALTRYLVVDFIEYEKETLFLKETAFRRVELTIGQVFGR